MRLLVLSAFLFSCALAPIAAQQSYGFWPGVTQFTSRGSLGTGAGEVHQGFPTSVVRGLGGAGCSCAVSGMRALIQTDDASSPAAFHLVLRTGSDTAGPGTTVSSELLRVAAALPPAGSGPAAWLFTITFRSSVATPCSGFMSAGVALPAAVPGAPQLSVHAASATSGAAAHPSAADLAWDVVPGAIAARHPSQATVWRIELLTGAATLQAGNIVPGTPTPLFGLGGAFPDTTRVGAASQGLALRALAAGGANASVTVIAAHGFDPSPFTVPGVLADCVYMDRATLIPGIVASGLGDGTPMILAQPGRGVLPAAGGAFLVWQAVVVDNGFAVTNATATVFN